MIYLEYNKDRTAWKTIFIPDKLNNKQKIETPTFAWKILFLLELIRTFENGNRRSSDMSRGVVDHDVRKRIRRLKRRNGTFI